MASASDDSAVTSVAIVGTFANLYAPIPLRQVDGTKYWGVTAVVPKGEGHTYKFLIASESRLDPVNSQQVTKPDGTQ